MSKRDRLTRAEDNTGMVPSEVLENMTPGAQPQADAPAPSTRRPKRDIPEEMRPYYVMFGQPRDGRPLQRIGRWKTKNRAERFLVEGRELLANTYEAVEIVQCRRRGWIDLR